MSTEKLHYAAKLLLDYAGGSLQTTNLNKALFYLDLHWLLETGSTFTGATYVALPQGPVLNDYKKIFALLVQRGDVSEGEFHYGSGYLAKPLTLRKAPPPPKDEHLELLARRVAADASSQAASELSEFSHKNVAWLSAHACGVGTPINMVLALEQLLDEEDEDWLSAPFTAEERAKMNRRYDGEFVSFE